MAGARQVAAAARTREDVLGWVAKGVGPSLWRDAAWDPAYLAWLAEEHPLEWWLDQFGAAPLSAGTAYSLLAKVQGRLGCRRSCRPWRAASAR